MFGVIRVKGNTNEINSVSEQGSEILHNAISGKQFEIAKYIIQKGADINLQIEMVKQHFIF